MADQQHELWHAQSDEVCYVMIATTMRRLQNGSTRARYGEQFAIMRSDAACDEGRGSRFELSTFFHS